MDHGYVPLKYLEFMNEVTRNWRDDCLIIRRRREMTRALEDRSGLWILVLADPNGMQEE